MMTDKKPTTMKTTFYGAVHMKPVLAVMNQDDYDEENWEVGERITVGTNNTFYKGWIRKITKSYVEIVTDDGPLWQIYLKNIDWIEN